MANALSYLFYGNNAGGGSSAQVNSLAKEFTDAWRGELDKIGGMYDEAWNSIGQMDDLAKRFGLEFDAFKETYTPYRDMLLEMSKADYARRNELAATFMGLARPDYDGVGNKAMADIAHQSALAREQIQRDMTRGGGNPSGSAHASAVRQNALEEAKNKTLAATVARTMEKDRVAGLVLPGMQIFDPVNSINAASNIDLNATKLLEGQLGATGAATGMRTTIAGDRAKSIAGPLGEAAGTFQGMAFTQQMANQAAQQDQPRELAYRTNSVMGHKPAIEYYWK